MQYAIGQPVPRDEDPRLVRGHGRYLDDISLVGQVHAVFVRAPVAHAIIRGIDTGPALAIPGVLTVLTGQDYAAAGLGNIPTAAPRKRRDGSPMYVPPRPALHAERVFHVGQPVAMVVAETLAAAREAAEAVEVDYDTLPAVLGTASAGDGAALREDCADNESFLFEVGDGQAVDAAFAGAAHVVSQDFVISRVHPSPMEPRGAIGVYDPGEDRYTVYAGCQRPYAWRKAIAVDLLRIPESKVSVITGDVGGSFGMKGSLHPEPGLVAWASRQVGRPVKWLCERTEAFVADDHGRDNVTRGELALDAEGNFLAMRVETHANLGAFVTMNGIGPPTTNIGGLGGQYRIPAMTVRVHGVFTNTTPLSPYRGAGRPEATYVTERLVDLAARRLGLDRVDIRRRNLIPVAAMPYRTPLVYTYDCGEFEAVLDKTLALADHDGYAARQEASKARGKLRGLGISTSIEVAARPSTETAEMRFDPTGNLTLLVGTTHHGQGHETTFKQIICGRLGIDPAGIRVIHGDTDKVAFGTGTGGSRVSTLGSMAVITAMDKVIAKGKRVAAHLLEAAAADVELEGGSFRIAGTDRAVPFKDVVIAAFKPERLPRDMEPGLYEVGTYNLETANYPNACHVCEVEVDADTGVVTLQRYSAVDDVGTEINPLLIKGQVHGGIVQGIGQALCEELIYDEEGQLLTGSFMDYCMPRADDVCMFAVGSHPVPTASNPLGTKGVGESGTVGALAAVMNAINDALAPLGVEHLEMPATPQRVWQAIQAARAAA